MQRQVLDWTVDDVSLWANLLCPIALDGDVKSRLLERQVDGRCLRAWGVQEWRNVGLIVEEDKIRELMAHVRGMQKLWDSETHWVDRDRVVEESIGEECLGRKPMDESSESAEAHETETDEAEAPASKVDRLTRELLQRNPVSGTRCFG